MSRALRELAAFGLKEAGVRGKTIWFFREGPARGIISVTATTLVRRWGALGDPSREENPLGHPYNPGKGRAAQIACI